MQNKDRFRSIDGLRGVAASGVLLGHTFGGPLFWTWSMVDLFFVISGFVITRSLLDTASTSSLSLRNFWIRRILRIWPVYYFTLALAIGISLTRSFMESAETHFPAHVAPCLVFLQFTRTYFYPTSIQAAFGSSLEGFSHSWSLAVEEQFYIVWPLAFLLLRNHARWVVMLCLFLISIALVLRHYGFVMILLLTRSDGLALGVLLAFVVHLKDQSSKLLRLTAPLAVVIGLLLVSAYLIESFSTWWNSPSQLSSFQDSYDSTFLPLGFSLIWFGCIGGLIDGRLLFLRRFLESPPMQWLGSISFALYMFHPIIIDGLFLIGAHLKSLTYARGQIALIPLSLLAAAGSKRFIEKPFNRLKVRFPLKLLQLK